MRSLIHEDWNNLDEKFAIVVGAPTSSETLAVQRLHEQKLVPVGGVVLKKRLHLLQFTGRAPPLERAAFLSKPVTEVRECILARRPQKQASHQVSVPW